MLVALSLAGCGVSSLFEADRPDRGQPFPASYKTETVAFLRTYLTDPVGVRDAGITEPALQMVSGQQRFVSCVKFDSRSSDGSYRGLRERAVLFVDGRLDRLIEDVRDLCAGAGYAPFPELQVMIR